MEKNDELEMGLFGSDNKFEIDLDFNEAAEGVLPQEQENEEGITPTSEKDIIPGDEGGLQSQEKVAEEGGEQQGDDKSEDSSPNLYHDLAAVLKEQGLLSTTKDDSIMDVDTLVTAFKEEIKQSEFSDLTEDQRAYLGAIRDGVTTDRFEEQRNDDINLQKITSEDIQGNAELRKRIIYQDLVNQGLADDNALKFANRSVDSGTDLEDAENALPNIKAYNKSQYDKEVANLKQDAVSRQEKLDKEKKELKDAIMSPKDIFENYSVTDNFKESVYKGMNTVVGHNEGGKPENALMQYRRENPVDFDAKLYYLFSLTNGFKDLNRFETSGTSSAVSNLERNLMNSHFAPSSGQPSFIEDPNSYSSGVGDELIL